MKQSEKGGGKSAGGSAPADGDEGCDELLDAARKRGCPDG